MDLAGIAAAALAGANVLPAVAASAPAGAAAAGTTGSWSSPFTPSGASTRVIGVHSVMLYTGKVLVFGALRPTQGYVYDPVTGAATETDPPADVECGSMTALRDGRILVVGGHAKGAKGINNILLFDPVKLTWTAQPASPMGRYYPTSTLLADGTVLISGGFDMNGNPNPDVEVWTPRRPGAAWGPCGRSAGRTRRGCTPTSGSCRAARSWRSRPVPRRSSTEHWTWTSYPKPKMKHGSGEGAVLLPGPASGSTKVMYIGGKPAGAATDARGDLRRRQPERGVVGAGLAAAAPHAHEPGPHA